MPESLQRIYQRYAPALLRKAERMTGSRAEAEDLVQQLFIDLMQRGKTDADLPYLYQAINRRSLNVLRDGKRRSALLAQHGGGAWVGRPSRLDDRVLSHDLLVRLVGGLDDAHAEVLTLHFVDGLDQGRVADLLGVSRRTVVARIARVREAAKALGGTP